MVYWAQEYTVTVPQKVFVCFLLSALLFTGIAALAYYRGFVNEPAETPMLVAVFVTLFLIIFFCFNLRQSSADETPAGIGEKKPEVRKYFGEAPPLIDHAYEELEELEAVVEESYLAEFSDADMVSKDIMAGGIVKVETIGGLGGSISMFKPFTFFQGNPELLQEAEGEEGEASVEVFYEQDGIHYINSNAFTNEDMEKLDSNFASLVESVVNKD